MLARRGRALRQRKLNLESAPWATEFADHRRCVMQLLAASGENERLCLLGAGNCNDVDLGELGRQYENIALVDLDGDTLAAVLAKQPIDIKSKLSLHAPFDFLGFESTLTAIDELAASQAARAIGQTLGLASHNVVASMCVLSQLISSVVDELGAAHAHVFDAVLAARAAHIELMLALLAPGGRGILILDFVSSDTYPSLRGTSRADLPRLTRQLIAQRNFFSGVNPLAIEQAFRTDARLAPRVSEVRLLRPWLWCMGPDRTYLVTALAFVKAA